LITVFDTGGLLALR